MTGRPPFQFLDTLRGRKRPTSVSTPHVSLTVSRTDDQPIMGLHDLAAAVGMDNAYRLMGHLHETEEARKVLMEQEFEKIGRMDRAVDHFYDEECDGRVDALIPPGAYVYWWLRSKEMGGDVGDFWRDEESSRDFLKRNPGCKVRNKSARPRSGWNGQIMAGTKYGDARKEAAA
jgi:hypothetical protein